MIKKELFLTDEIIRASQYFPVIEERYNHFSKENILSVSYTDVIIDFDPRKINSLLKANYILFEENEGAYNHLCISNYKSNYMYAESFFFTNNDRYIRHQKRVKINEIKIYDKDGQLYLNDKP